MTKLLLLTVAIASAMVTLCVAGGCQSTPDQRAENNGAAESHPLDNALRDVPLEEAKQAAAADDRVLLVVGTADWCGPCQHMKANTWPDPRIVRWVDRHGTILYLDIDEHPETSSELGIRSIPQIIAFRDGVEIDRITGSRDAETFLDWLNGLVGKEVARAGE